MHSRSLTSPLALLANLIRIRSPLRLANTNTCVCVWGGGGRGGGGGGGGEGGGGGGGGRGGLACGQIRIQGRRGGFVWLSTNTKGEGSTYARGSGEKQPIFVISRVEGKGDSYG